MDFIIREFRDSIVNEINKYDLPMEVKRLVLLEIMQEITRQVEISIKKSIEEIKADEKETNENGN